MMEANKAANPIGENLKTLVSVKSELIRLKLIDKLSQGGAAFMSLLVVLIITCVGLLLLGFSIALLMSDYLDSYIKGFAATGGLTLIFALCVYLFRKALIEKRVVNRLVVMFLKKPDQNSWHNG
jgi:hypothetical protein